MKFIVFILAIVLLATVIKGNPLSEKNKINYDNYKVFKILIQNEEQREFYNNLADHNKNFNIWYSDAKEMHIMVAPTEFNYFANLTSTYSGLTNVWITNVQSLIEEETSISERADNSTFGWTRYYNLDAIEAWLDNILKTYPNVTEDIFVGVSYEGRIIRGIKISYKTGNPGIFIESNIHAREWITSATATWFINELLTSTDINVRLIAENYDWYIIPVFNVDGFVYTHETDRMWRKTRQPSRTSDCIGADPNRNFDSYWMVNGGASSNPCSQTYAGLFPYSEPEVRALTDYIASIKDRINILLAFHSYSQLLLSPYGHTAEEFPDNYDDMQQVAKAYADAVNGLSYKTQYEYGSAASVLYIASGSTIDWAYNEQDILLTYTIEFRDKGRFGFILPPVQIIPNCEETLAGMLALIAEAETLGYLDVKY